MFEGGLLSALEQPISMQIEPKAPSRRRRLFRRIILTLLVILTCILLVPTLSLLLLAQGNPKPLQQDFTPSDRAARQFESSYDSVVNRADSAGESFAILFTSAEFASWLNKRYTEATGDEVDTVELPGPIDTLRFSELENIQVAFEPDRMSLYAEANVAPQTTLGLLLHAHIVIDEDTGRLVVKVTDAQMGGLRMPEEIRDSLAAPIEDALTQRLDFRNSYRLDSIMMLNNELLITGHILGTEK